MKKNPKIDMTTSQLDLLYNAGPSIKAPSGRLIIRCILHCPSIIAVRSVIQ